MPTKPGGGPNYVAGGVIASIAGGITAAIITTLTITTLNLTEQSAPSLSAAGTSKLYADSTSHSVKVSNNGGSYSELGATGANPSASITGTAINGSASTFMRSDGAPALASGVTLTAPVLGTPASGALTNCTAVPAAQLTGTATNLTLATPILGTPQSGTLTNCTLPIGGVTGGTNHNAATYGASGLGTGIAPGTSGNLLTSNGTDWTSAAAASTITGTTQSSTPFLTVIGSSNLNSATGIDNTGVGYQAHSRKHWTDFCRVSGWQGRNRNQQYDYWLSNLKTIIAHELGHAFGYTHSEDVSSPMYQGAL